MVSSVIGTTYILEQIAKAIYSLRSEIAIFIFAFIGHAFLFGRYSLQGKPAKLSKKKGTDDNAVESCIDDNAPPEHSSRGANAAALVSMLELDCSHACRGILLNSGGPECSFNFDTALSLSSAGLPSTKALNINFSDLRKTTI